MDNEKTYQTEGLNRLIVAISLLSADYDTQVNAFPSFVHIPDELALVYDDCLLVVKPTLEKERDNNALLMRLNKLDHLLEEMSSDPNCWTLDALKLKPQWENIRSYARFVLELLPASDSLHLHWLNYVK